MLSAYQKIEGRAGKSPAVLSTDKEAAFLSSLFQDHLLSKDTEFRQKQGISDLAVLDSAIGRVRSKLAQIRARERLRADSWAALLPRVEKSLNNEDGGFVW